MIDTFRNRQKRIKFRSGKGTHEKGFVLRPVTTLSGTDTWPLPQKACGRERRVRRNGRVCPAPCDNSHNVPFMPVTCLTPKEKT